MDLHSLKKQHTKSLPKSKCKRFPTKRWGVYHYLAKKSFTADYDEYADSLLGHNNDCPGKTTVQCQCRFEILVEQFRILWWFEFCNYRHTLILVPPLHCAVEISVLPSMLTEVGYSRYLHVANNDRRGGCRVSPENRLKPSFRHRQSCICCQTFQRSLGRNSAGVVGITSVEDIVKVIIES